MVSQQLRSRGFREPIIWKHWKHWKHCIALILDVEQRPSDQALAYWRRAGMDPAIYEARKSARPFNFADSCHPIPVGYTRVKQGDTLRAGGRAWDVHIGHGHAPEHLTLWSRDDNLVIAGDQIIASISPNLGVYPTEPDADPVGEWLESCGRLAALAHEDHLVLSGHKLPFTGLPVRMRQLIENHHGALDRLRLHLASPKTARIIKTISSNIIMRAIFALSKLSAICPARAENKKNGKMNTKAIIVTIICTLPPVSLAIT